MKDLKTLIDVKPVSTPAVRTADATGTGVDRSKAQSLTFLLHIGVGGITFTGTDKIDFIMEESDDDSTYTACADAAIIGATGTSSGIVMSLQAAHAAAAVYAYGYRGSKRYARMRIDFSGTHGTGTAMAISAVLSHLQDAPAVA